MEIPKQTCQIETSMPEADRIWVNDFSCGFINIWHFWKYTLKFGLGLHELKCCFHEYYYWPVLLGKSLHLIFEPQSLEVNRDQLIIYKHPNHYY